MPNTLTERANPRLLNPPEPRNVTNLGLTLSLSLTGAQATSGGGGGGGGGSTGQLVLNDAAQTGFILMMGYY